MTLGELLVLAIGGDAERVDRALEKYRTWSGRSGMCARTGGFGWCTSPRQRIGGDGVRERSGGDPLEAETDGDAVGFYRALGFEVVGLGEKYPGVKRFVVTLRA